MSGEPGPDSPSPWRVRARQVAVGAILIGLGMSIGASVRQSLPGSSKPSPSPTPSSPVTSSPPATGGRVTGLPPGGSGALILLSGSAQGLPGGPGGELVWRVDLASGRVQMGPAVATTEAPTGGFVYPNYTGNATPPAPIATTPKQVAVYEQSGGNAFLATVPIAGSDFGSIPLQPQAAIADYSVAPGGRIAFVNTNWTGPQGPPMQQVGVLGRRLAYQGRTPRLLLTDAYTLGRGLYATAVQGRNPGGPGSRPVVLRVVSGRLRVVLAGWQVLGEDPAGRGLLVERITRFGSRVRISPRVMLWRPGSSPRPDLNPDLAVESVLVSFHGGVGGLLVSGLFHGSPGLFQTLPRGTVAPLPLPAGLDPSMIDSAAFADNETVYLVDGLGEAYVCQISIGECRTLRISGPLSELPILALAWAR